jgi:hypothetical protein
MYARKLLAEGWSRVWVTRSLQGFPSYLRNLRFSETKALFGVYCGRTPPDPLRKVEPDLCPCGTGKIETQHLFMSCPRFNDLRQKMTSKTKGTIGTREFVLLEENIKPVMEFLKATGIGFARNLGENRDGGQSEKVENDKDGGMEDIAFGVFEK